MGIDIWQAGARSCENSGEGWPNDTAYCSGGFPNSTAIGRGRAVLLLARGDSPHGGATTLAQPAAAGSSTVLVGASVLPSTTRSASRIPLRRRPPTARASVPSPARGPSTPHPPPASRLRASFASGRRRPGPTAAEATRAPSFPTGRLPRRASPVSRWSGAPGRWPARSGRSSPTRSPPRSATPTTVPSRSRRLWPHRRWPAPTVSNAGTCQLYATSSAPPSGPLAPDGTSYWDGCQWEAKNISVTGNVFQFDPSVIASSAPLVGGGTTTTCTAAHTGRLRDQLHGVPGIRGGAVRYADGRERDDEQFVLYRVPIMGLRLHDESAVQPERSRQPAGSAAQSRGAGLTMSGRTTSTAGRGAGTRTCSAPVLPCRPTRQQGKACRLAPAGSWTCQPGMPTGSRTGPPAREAFAVSSRYVR